MDSNDGIQAWDAAAGNYIDRIGWGGDSFDRRFAPFLTQQLGDANDKRVLDLGCGHGWLTGRLADSGADVVGVDGSSALISAAQRAYPQVEFVIHDLTAGLPWRHRQFDCIVSHMVLMDLPDIAPLIADIAAALTPKGSFVFTILHPASSVDNQSRTQIPVRGVGTSTATCPTSSDRSSRSAVTLITTDR